MNFPERDLLKFRRNLLIVIQYSKSKQSFEKCQMDKFSGTKLSEKYQKNSQIWFLKV